MPIKYKTVTGESKEAFDKELNRLVGNGWKIAGELQATQKIGGSSLSHNSETTLSILLQKFFTDEEVKATEENERILREKQTQDAEDNLKWTGIVMIGATVLYIIIEYLTKIF